MPPKIPIAAVVEEPSLNANSAEKVATKTIPKARRLKGPNPLCIFQKTPAKVSVPITAIIHIKWFSIATSPLLSGESIHLAIAKRLLSHSLTPRLTAQMSIPSQIESDSRRTGGRPRLPNYRPVLLRGPALLACHWATL